MSSVLTQTLVQTVPDFSFPADETFAPAPIVLFTVPGTVPARVESVYMLLNYFDSTAYGDVFILRLNDVSTATVWSGESFYNNEPQNVVELCWSRQGVDTGPGGGLLWSYAEGEEPYAFWSGRLPDLVLRPGSTVTISGYRGELMDPTLVLPVTNCAVSYTPGSDGGAVTTSDILPLLVPQTA